MGIEKWMTESGLEEILYNRERSMIIHLVVIEGIRGGMNGMGLMLITQSKSISSGIQEIYVSPVRPPLV